MNKVPTFRTGPCGTKIWELYGELHREDGPAIEHYNGHFYWYLYGKMLNPVDVIKDSKLKKKYPELINAMIIHLVHEA